MSNDHAALDAAILAAIRGGITTAGALESDPAVSCATAPHATWRRTAYRVIDARLQALRKAGKISFDRKAGWRII